MGYIDPLIRQLSTPLKQVHTMNEFRCYEAKIEESEKASSYWESNPGHPWVEPPVLCH